jgi:hypothetical protein
MNYKQPSLLAALLALSFAVTAQKVTVKGTVADTSSNKSLKNAIVTLLSPTDSILRAFTRVKDDGTYAIENVKPGKYIFGVSHPSFGEYIDDVTVGASGLTQPKIALTSKAKLLEAVIVKSKNPIRIKGDTTIYTADSFKVSANANVEELLKKLPGIQVDKNGEIKAMGEKVTKVLVDGEEFFGEDPGMAVKNLRADAVKEVQVFDKKSDQAEFTGIDDGKTQKTINLKLKDDRKRGYFGKIDAAGGLVKNIDDRYNTNLMYSSFLGKRKITGFLLNGNTGQDGLSWQDEQKFGGGDNEGMQFDEESGMTWFQGGGGNADDEPFVNTENGFIINNNAGVQYSNKYNDKTSINFSPRFNEQRYTNVQDVNQQNNVIGLNTTSYQSTAVNRKNLKLRGVIDSKLDSANSLKVTLTSNFYTSSSRVIDSSFTTIKNNFLNRSEGDETVNSEKQALGADVVFNHKFKKARRTLSLNTNLNYLTSDADILFKSDNFYASEPDSILRQQKNRDRQNVKVSAKATYTEPLNKDFSLELSYQFANTNSLNNLETYNLNPINSKFDLFDNNFSNNFKSNLTQNTPSTKISYNKKKFKANIGTGVSLINFNLQNISLNTTQKRNYTNFFPSLNVTYNYKSNHSLRFNYSGSNRLPSITDLQLLVDNSNPNFIKIGNPNLNPTFINRFAFTQNGYNFIKDMWNYQSLTLSFENNSITQNQIFNTTSSGKAVSQAVNTNGNYSINFWGGMGFKAKKIDTRFFLSLNVNKNRFVSFQNYAKNVSDNVNFGINTSVQKSKEKKYDFSLDLMPSLNNQKASLTNSTNKFVTFNVRTNATLYIKKVWSIITDYNLLNRPAVQGRPSITNHFWNARIQKTFKKDEFTAYVTVRDILNQNIGIDRNFGENSFTETVNQRLRRYFMVGFAWNFKNKATAKK